MTGIDTERAKKLLCDLIAIPTVNPMGRPHDRTEPVERAAVDYIEQLFAPHGVRMQRQACGAFHESLLVIVPGRTDAPGTLLESHTDTVPADDWPDRAFQPRVEGDTIYGRGANDDKGSVVAMILAVLDLLESGRTPPQPVYLLAAGDEEHGATGIKEFLRTCRLPLGRGVFGEPTENVPVVQHKGTARWDITTHGRSAHTSRPELGRNAILDMTKVIDALARHQEALGRRHTSELMTGPSLTVTMIEGGRTRNAVPDQCTVAVDFRLIPGMDLVEARREVIEMLGKLDVETTHSEPHCMSPPLSTSPADPFVTGAVDICRAELGRDVQAIGVPYGTDGTWMPKEAPTIVLGPGSAESAHAVDEHVSISQVAQCARIYERILLRDWA